ncbi:MAG TPA: ATP-dependent Clp protease adaptor ClpS [Nannocystis exedens]|nr:ATP-dependent Clp protease adaptor ClpS [Nannocystis exedens]
MAKRSNKNPEGGVVLKEKVERKIKRPRMYRVLIHNDDYTTMEFVIHLLKAVFHRSESDSIQIMLHIHNTGVGVAGVYTYEVAETKVAQVHALARQVDCPLVASMEPEEDPDAER